jgi:hypothetical protein
VTANHSQSSANTAAPMRTTRSLLSCRLRHALPTSSAPGTGEPTTLSTTIGTPTRAATSSPKASTLSTVRENLITSSFQSV